MTQLFLANVLFGTLLACADSGNISTTSHATEMAEAAAAVFVDAKSDISVDIASFRRESPRRSVTVTAFKNDDPATELNLIIVDRRLVFLAISSGRAQPVPRDTVVKFIEDASRLKYSGMTQPRRKGLVRLAFRADSGGVVTESYADIDAATGSLVVFGIPR